MKKLTGFIAAVFLLIIPVAGISAKDYTLPYLLTLNPATEMNVVRLTSDSVKVTVEYGTSQNLGRTIEAQEFRIRGIRTSASSNGYDPIPENNPEINVFQQIAKLTNLTPNTRYYYRVVTVRGGKNESTKIYSFKTAPVNGEDFSFALVSDLQQRIDVLPTVKQIGQKKPDFIVYGGDLQNTPWKAGEWFPVDGCFVPEEEKGKSFFETLQQDSDGCELIQYIPLFVTPGNHEVDDQRFLSDKAMAIEWQNRRRQWSMSIYLQMFRPLYPSQQPQPNGTHWYSVQYGDLHITNISVFRWHPWDAFEAPGWVVFDDISEGSPQIEWLTADLKNAKSRYKWVNMHWHMLNRGEDVYYPVSSPVVRGNTVTYPEGDLTWTVLRPLFEKYGVNGVSFGHSHVYERYLINNVNYIEAASIGNNYRDYTKPYVHPSGNLPVLEYNEARTFLIVNRTKTGLFGTAYIASGVNAGLVFDTFTIVPSR